MVVQLGLRGEPAWHRNLRKRCKRARDWVKQRSTGVIGKRKLKKIRTAVAFLSSHHSFRFQDLPFQNPTCNQHMTWYCRNCQQNNPEKVDRCRSCAKHWSEVWTKPAKRRSRSKSARGATSYKGANNKGQQEEQVDWSLFPEKVPWIPTTPSTRIVRKPEMMDGHGAEAQHPSQSTLVTPLEAALTSEEERKLEHLKGLQEMGMELTRQMQSQLEQLTAKQQANQATKSLTHGHLNRLNKLKSQVTAAGKKIQDLDAEWKAFMEKTVQKVRQRAMMFQQCRGDLLENYNAKIQELRQIKQEVSLASQSLLENQWAAPTIQEAPMIAEQLAELDQVIDVETFTGHVDLTGDMEEDEISENDLPTQPRVKGSPKVPKSFRASQSPTKVATQHLKPKNKDGREKEKEDK